MAEYINKEQLLSYLFSKQDEQLDVMKEIAEFPSEDYPNYNQGWNDACDYIRDCALAMLKDVPAADVAEVRHAFWSDYGSGVCCTNCGVSLFHQDENNNWGIEPSKFMFCPSCGARMDKEDEHEAD